MRDVTFLEHSMSGREMTLVFQIKLSSWYAVCSDNKYIYFHIHIHVYICLIFFEKIKINKENIILCKRNLKMIYIFLI